MADDERTKSGSIPDPIPEVRDEGPGGTDLNFPSESAEAREAEGTGSVPHPTRPSDGEGDVSSD